MRVGDVLRLAFTRTGDNPILGGLREHGFGTDRAWKTEGRSRLRVLSDADSPLHVRTEGPVPEPVESIADGVRTLVVDQASTPARPMPDDLPARVWDVGRVVVSDVPDWRTVVDWARPLYALDGPPPADLEAIAARIRSDHDDRAGRIGAALRWVQDEIRYFGIEMGADSHRPASPAQTLERRFGDCKAKALLLMALLEALGVESRAALVDSDGRIESPAHPWRLHAFDHVIVRVVEDGVAHWLDPTLSHRRGALGDLHEPDYGMALVLAPGSDALVPMTPERTAAAVVTSKRLVVSDEPDVADTFEVRTRLPAAHAYRLRRQIEREGLQQLDEDYLGYYDRQLGGVERGAPLEVEELPDGGLELVERYTLDFWAGGGSTVRRRTLRAAELDDEFVEFDDVENADRAFSLLGARRHVERWTISLPRATEVRRGESRHETPWFRFDEAVRIAEDGTEVTVTARFEPLADEVAADEVEDYRAALDALYDAVEFRLVDRPPPTPFERLVEAIGHRPHVGSGEGEALATVKRGAIGIGLLAVGVAVVRRRRERDSAVADERPEAGRDDGTACTTDGIDGVVSRTYRISNALRRQVLLHQYRGATRSLVHLTAMTILLVVAATTLVYVVRGDFRGADAWVPLLCVVGAGWACYALVLGIGMAHSMWTVREATEYRFELDARRFVEDGSDGTRVELVLDELVGVRFDPRWIILGESACRLHVLPRTAFATEADWQRARTLLERYEKRKELSRVNLDETCASITMRRRRRGERDGLSSVPSRASPCRSGPGAACSVGARTVSP